MQIKLTKVGLIMTVCSWKCTEAKLNILTTWRLKNVGPQQTGCRNKAFLAIKIRRTLKRTNDALLNLSDSELPVPPPAVLV